MNYFSKMCGSVHCVWNTKVKGLRSLQAGGLSSLLFQSQLNFGQSFVVEAEPNSPPLLFSFHRCHVVGALFPLLPLIYIVMQTNQSLPFIYCS